LTLQIERGFAHAAPSTTAASGATLSRPSGLLPEPLHSATDETDAFLELHDCFFPLEKPANPAE